MHNASPAESESPSADELSDMPATEEKTSIQDLLSTGQFTRLSQAVIVLDKLILAARTVVTEQIAASELLKLDDPLTQKEAFANEAPGNLNSQRDRNLSFENSSGQQIISPQDFQLRNEFLTCIINSNLVSLNSPVTLHQLETFEEKRDALSQKLAELELKQNSKNPADVVVGAQEISKRIDRLRPIIEEMESIDSLLPDVQQSYAAKLVSLMKQTMRFTEASDSSGVSNKAGQYFQGLLETFHELKLYINDDGLTPGGGELVMRGLSYNEEAVNGLNKSFKQKIGSAIDKQKMPDRQLSSTAFNPYPNPNRLQRSSALTTNTQTTSPESQTGPIRHRRSR